MIGKFVPLEPWILKHVVPHLCHGVRVFSVTNDFRIELGIPWGGYLDGDFFKPYTVLVTRECIEDDDVAIIPYVCDFIRDALDAHQREFRIAVNACV